MILSRHHFLWLFAIFAQVFFHLSISFAQDSVNVQVKVFDLQLNPVPSLEITIDNLNPITTGENGIAFLSIPQASIPPAIIHISNDKLEAESWNYSKGTLEVIVREKKYRTIHIKIIDRINNVPLEGIRVITRYPGTGPLFTDAQGSFTLILPDTVTFKRDDFFNIRGYQIINRNLNDKGGVIEVNEVIKKNVAIKPDSSQKQSVRSRTVMPNSKPILPIAPRKILNDINLNDLDSITSLTVLFTLVKNLDFNKLDSASKIALDNKFYELSRLNTLATLITTPALELINDSSIINDDLLLLIEKIQNEGTLLDVFREEFELATEKIKIKLEDGGENLSLDERQMLLQLILNLKELLRQNEERFYRNNMYYQEEINNLQSQLSDILELEDRLIESEESKQKFRQQLIFTSLTLAVLIGFILLLIYLIRIFIAQRNELTRVNKEIETINNNLEAIVAEKTDSLERINKELDTFLYRSSHNLRRPLTSIKGLTSLAELSLNRDGIALFEKVSSISGDMEKMIDKLGMMNYINQPTDFNTIDFKQFIKKVEKKYSEELKQSKIQFKWDVQPELDFKSYPLVMELIIQNLVENAFFYCKYTSSKRPKVELSVHLDQSQKNLNLTIMDNGCGIDPEFQVKIWDMFFIGNVASKGNGLGLYITKKAVESLKGTISLDSKTGHHCSFYIILPLLPDSLQALKNS